MQLKTLREARTYTHKEAHVAVVSQRVLIVSSAHGADLCARTHAHADVAPCFPAFICMSLKSCVCVCVCRLLNV